MVTVGTGQYTYELLDSWGKLPLGQSFGPVSATATDSQDRIYVFQRTDPPFWCWTAKGTSSTRGARAP